MMWEQNFPKRPTYSAVAKHERVCVNTVRKYMAEYESNGFIADPLENQVIRSSLGRDGYHFRSEFSFEVEQFLLTLRVDDLSRPLYSYVHKLCEEFGIIKSKTFMWTWWKRRFEFDATLRKSSFIPKDKFKCVNWLKYYEYRMYVNYFKDHTIFNFLDEKHIHNHNGHDLRVRMNPITGIIDGN